MLLILSSCGGGSSGENNDNAPLPDSSISGGIVDTPVSPDSPTSDGTVDTPTSPHSFISGGTADSPVSMSLEVKNEISSNSFFNYYKYEGRKNETIIIYSDLEYALTADHRRNCAAKSNSPYAFINIKIYTRNLSDVIGGACDEGTTFVIPEDGTYFIHVDYGSSNSGYFYVASVPPNINAPLSEKMDGTPNSPMEMIKYNNNQISTNAFYNYFYYTGKKDEEIIIHATLNQPMTASYRSACISSGYAPRNIKIYKNSFTDLVGGTCSDDITYTLPEDGTYIFYFDYYTTNTRNSGYFNFTSVQKD